MNNLQRLMRDIESRLNDYYAGVTGKQETIESFVEYFGGLIEKVKIQLVPKHNKWLVFDEVANNWLVFEKNDKGISQIIETPDLSEATIILNKEIK